jgi:hypothetical protein
VRAESPARRSEVHCTLQALDEASVKGAQTSESYSGRVRFDPSCTVRGLDLPCS